MNKNVSWGMLKYRTNDPSKISFVIPAALGKGEYLLSIVTQFSGGSKERKDPKTLLLNYVLTRSRPYINTASCVASTQEAVWH